MDNISVAAPDLSDLEKTYVEEAVDSTWISSSGTFVERFEERFSKLCQTDFATTVTNGTVALHLVLEALEIGPGDEVIVPSFTYVASVNAIRYVGATPIFVDVDPATWCLNPEDVEQAVSERTAAIIAVHLYGHPADMDRINSLAEEHDLTVVEDAAEAHFAEYKGEPTGGLGDVATFSFYGNKPFTTGEGGMITTDSDELDEKLRLLKNQGMDPNERYYFPVVGYNYRMTNIACAIGCAQLERREEILQTRNQVYEWYRTHLPETDAFSLQPVAEWAEPTPWMFSLTLDPEQAGGSRDELRDHLDEHGIETRPFFIPVHTLPPYEKEARAQQPEVPTGERLSKTGINLPTHADIREHDVERICRRIEIFLNDGEA